MKTYFRIIICLCFLFSCTSKTTNQEGESINTIEENEDVDNYNDSSCKLDDGTYSANVDYNNPNTGYSQSYTLDIDVRDCQVIQINFPNDGYLDEDHISAADIDEDGNASVYGEDGKTYEIQIDK